MRLVPSYEEEVAPTPMDPYVPLVVVEEDSGQLR